MYIYIYIYIYIFLTLTKDISIPHSKTGKFTPQPYN